MNTQVADKQQLDVGELPGERGEIAVFAPPRLPWHKAIEERFGISRGGWKVLTEAIYPNAKTSDSIVLALSYCQSRKLDPLKRPVNIVPMRQKRGNDWVEVETIWPSIAELRTTAMRTSDYAGKDATAFGPTTEQTFKGKVKEWENRKEVWNERETTLKFPEWAEVTVYRMVRGIRCAFVGPKVFWLEAYATQGRWSELPNEMWGDRPFGQLDKCAEAAALRCAFPEELGNQYAAEEMEGRRMLEDAAAAARDVSPRPAAISGPPRRSPANGNGSTAPVTDSPSTSPADDGNTIDGEVTKPATASGPPRRAPEQNGKPQQQAQASAGVPNPSDSQAFFSWIEGKLANCKDADAVMLVWTDEIYEKVPDALHDDANSILQKYLNKNGGGQ